MAKGRKLLALDLSTACTGFAVFDLVSKKLGDCGYIKPNEKGISKLKYPRNALEKILRMIPDIMVLVSRYNPEELVIEEVNRGISRIGQKSLDALHFFLLSALREARPDLLNTLTYIDSNGRKGWRTSLGMALSAEDKTHNAFARKHNKKKGVDKLPIINWKHLAARFVNERYDLSLDVDKRVSDGDIADAICLGTVHLSKKT